MDFVKALTIKFPQNLNEEQEAIIIRLEEELISKDIVIEHTETEIGLYNKKYINKPNISFNDYLNEWKILKDNLIKWDILSNDNYKNAFCLKQIDINSTPELPELDLDKFIAKVPDNDPKILEIQAKIAKLKKK